MILPNKYEDLNYNSLVVGVRIIGTLQVKEYDINLLFEKFKEEIGIIRYFDLLTFLWLANIIEVENNQIRLSYVVK